MDGGGEMEGGLAGSERREREDGGRRHVRAPVPSHLSLISSHCGLNEVPLNMRGFIKGEMALSREAV